ncbi:MAG: 2-oxoacid:acceptor oxidoreductase subunit alpha [Deltaproteobacteria bacterium]|nr:2-oxoacid:acceptor oxidoreductase subunit alpha [Deltaproteobacteria bacterium]MBW2414425.1 2-oxoacid:acceptor oxidoreductase subunit alpha [Deltaproteobacteria bacterium]
MSSTGPGANSGKIEEVESIVIRFAGDSGDGMQLTGTELTRAVALSGNDIATFPDFPAEIRAPAGTTYGVSGFQLQFSSSEIFTPGDAAGVLITMNPAALRTNLSTLEPGGLLIVDSGAFKKRNLQLSGYEVSPLEDDSLSGYQLIPVDMTRAVTVALKGSGLSPGDVQRCRNFFALGLVFWLYGRDEKREVESIRAKFRARPEVAEANVKAFKAGHAYGETTEAFKSRYHVPAADLEPGEYRNVTGNEALATGLVAAALLADRRMVYASYPITPASDILHYLAAHQRYPVTTFQAEDEIAAVTAAIGASFGGAIGVTGTSGPGFALKQEGVGLAVMAELPLVLIDVQRGGPSTGLPTKPEQGDLLQAIFGRNSESPVAVIAPARPSECFDMAIEAVRLATQHMCPVVLLSDNTLANGAEPWRLPEISDLAPIEPGFRTDAETFAPYLRDPDTLARPWAPPGTPGFEHRIGGLEKQDVTGDVSYDPANHGHMNAMRAAKIAKIADRLPPVDVYGDAEGDLLLVGFGGTYGALRQAAQSLRGEGHRVGHAQLRYLNPLQSDIDEVLRRYRRVLIPELNPGQLRMLLRARTLLDLEGLNKVDGTPFMVREVVEAARRLIGPAAAKELRA